MAVISQSTTSSSRTHDGLAFWKLKEPASTITHFVAMTSALCSMPFLMVKASSYTNYRYPLASFLFIFSMILLYGASASYHGITTTPARTQILKKIDHIMIYFLIAGSYSPVCLLVLPDSSGLPLFYSVWSFAIAGFVLTLFWVDSPKWLNSLIYIAMGWLCIFAIRSIYLHLSGEAFAWLLAGGIIYTIGGVIYALKLPILSFLPKAFGAHEIFHLFVMAGSFCHFILVYSYLL